jgi:hypothetical protein
MHCVMYCCLAGILWVIGTPSVTAADWKEPARGVGDWPEEVGTHKPHSRGDGTKTGSLGNHRAVVNVSNKCDAVWIRVPWRRRDLDASSKATLVFDASTNEQIHNVVRAEINREYGDIIFHPASGPGRYYIYYMPYTFQFFKGRGRLDSVPDGVRPLRSDGGLRDSHRDK